MLKVVHDIAVGYLVRPPFDGDRFARPSRSFCGLRDLGDSTCHLTTDRDLALTFDNLNEMFQFVDVALNVSGRK